MYEVTMPKLSDSMEEGKIIEWKVKEGDAVHQGDILADVESDKATMELECFQSGKLAQIIHGDGEEVPVGEVIAFIADAGEAQEKPAAAEQRPAPKKLARPKQKAESEPAQVKPAEPAKPPKEAAPERRPERKPQARERAAISPYARKLAQEKGVDYASIQGSGPDGRIVARDIEQAVAAKPEKQDVEPLARVLAERYSVDLSGIKGAGGGGRITVEDVEAVRHQGAEPLVAPSPDDELPPLELVEGEADVEDAPFRLRTQARRVTASKHVIPHFYITQAVDVTVLMQRKDALKEKHGATVTHVIMLACLKAIAGHPEINRSYDHGRIIKWKGVHLGLAIDTEQGLTVAVLRDAQELSLKDLVERTQAVVQRARAGKLSADDRRHPTFAITNLGMFDVEHFQPIINPPSAVTLAVATAAPAPVVRDDALRVGRVMRLTAACDHRIVDGATVARFMADLKKLLEDPGALLKDA